MCRFSRFHCSQISVFPSLSLRGTPTHYRQTKRFPPVGQALLASAMFDNSPFSQIWREGLPPICPIKEVSAISSDSFPGDQEGEVPSRVSEALEWLSDAGKPLTRIVDAVTHTVS